MYITVAICTWNRAKLLDQTLLQIRALVIPDGVTWELLVVDNNSTDNTKDVISRYAGMLPIKQLIEPKQGHSHARNCAMEAAQGDLLLWTDDDVLVDPHWMSAYFDAAARHPDAEYFGGLILPWFEHAPPAWLSKNQSPLQSVLVIRDLGQIKREFAPGETPFGANMAFRRSAYRTQAFDPQLGRVKNGVIGHDETDYCTRLQEKGVRGVWVPTARLQHYVVSARMTQTYVRRFFEGYGRTQVRLQERSSSNRTMGAPRWMYRRFCELYLGYLLCRTLGRNDWVRLYTQAAEVLGQILEHRRLASSSDS